MFDPTDVPADPLDLITEGLRRLEGEDRARWSGPAQTDRAVGLLQLHARLEAEATRAAAVWEASGAWQEDGSRSACASLARRTGRSPGTCSRMLRTGRLGLTHDMVGKAIGTGELPVDHAASLGRALKDREELFDEYEHELLDAARRLDHPRFARLLAAWKQIVDDRLGIDREAEAFDRRKFHVSELMDGISRFDGVTDAEGAAVVRAALDAYTVLDPEDMAGPRRTPEEVRHDALIAALAASINGAVPGLPKRTIDAIVSYELLLGQQPPSIEEARCEIVGVGPVPPSILRRLAAHSAIGRIIATAAGLPLDVGAQVRAFNRTHRRAIRFRDDTCVWPGCNMPGEWSEIDHVIEHVRGGTTSVENGRFLCVRHHHLRHKGWLVEYDAVTNHSQVTSPVGITYSSDPDPPPW